MSGQFYHNDVFAKKELVHLDRCIREVEECWTPVFLTSTVHRTPVPPDDTQGLTGHNNKVSLIVAVGEGWIWPYSQCFFSVFQVIRKS